MLWVTVILDFLVWIYEQGFLKLLECFLRVPLQQKAWKPLSYYLMCNTNASHLEMYILMTYHSSLWTNCTISGTNMFYIEACYTPSLVTVLFVFLQRLCHLCIYFSVFWDLYCAAPERRDSCDHSSEAKAFHDLVSLRILLIYLFFIFLLMHYSVIGLDTTVVTIIKLSF